MNSHPLKTEIASELTLANMKIHRLTVENADLNRKLRIPRFGDAAVPFLLGIVVGLLIAACLIQFL